MTVFSTMAKAATILFVAQTAQAETITYTYELFGSVTVGGLSTMDVPIVVNGVGDTDGVFNIDATRIANEFSGTISVGQAVYSFLEPVYAARSGGTLGLTADIVGTNINTVLSGNLVPITYGLNTDAMFLLDPGTTFGSFDTDGGLLTIDSFSFDSTVSFTALVGDNIPAAVPLPASSLLLLTAIGGFGAMARRRKS